MTTEYSAKVKAIELAELFSEDSAATAADLGKITEKNLSEDFVNELCSGVVKLTQTSYNIHTEEEYKERLTMLQLIRNAIEKIEKEQVNIKNHL